MHKGAEVLGTDMLRALLFVFVTFRIALCQLGLVGADDILSLVQ